MTDTTLLSPVAQAVLDTYHRELPPDYEPGGLAAALRAVADLVVPQGGPFLVTASEDRVRHQILKIADELEEQG